MHTRVFDPALLADAPLIDHHCHGVTENELNRQEFEAMITESNWPPRFGSVFDSQLGVAVRRWCAPELGLEPHASAAAYLQRRAELGARAVNERLLRAANISRYLVETGFKGEQILSPAQLAARAASSADEIVRLEVIAEQVIGAIDSPTQFAAAFAERLEQQLKGAVGVKTIAAYRIGLDFDPRPPHDAEVTAAATEWLRQIADTGSVRLAHPVLIRHGIWEAVRLRVPIQFHIGFGDPDVDLHRCNPLLLTEFLRLTREYQGANMMLLHCYPFHREAGYLAHCFPQVFCDVGLAINYVGARAPQVLAESLELAPFNKVLFSSDAWGLSELYYLGAKLFRRALSKTLDGWIAAGEWCTADAEQLVRQITHENAAAAYRLVEHPRFVAEGTQ